MATLPSPEITVETTNDGKNIGVTAKRDGKSRTWTSEGNSVAEAVKGVFDKFLADPRSGEFHK